MKNVWKGTQVSVFVYSSKLVDLQTLVDSLRGNPDFDFFSLIIIVFQWFLMIFGWFCMKQYTFQGNYCFNPIDTKKKCFLYCVAQEPLKKVWNEQKSWKQLKKVFQPAFGCAQHLILVKIHNMQQWKWLNPTPSNK